MRLLLVDDEPRVLEGLERVLSTNLGDEWDTVTAGSGAEALALLEAQPVDVVVTDMQMSQMNGVELLTHIHSRHPETIRIVLSGEMEQAGYAAIVHTHQFLAKPCSTPLLVATIRRATLLRGLLNDAGVRSAIGNLDRLPPVPRLYSELQQVLAGADAGADDIARVISRDPAMAAKILQLANSAFFGRAAVVESMHDAVVRLGTAVMQVLAIRAGIFDWANRGSAASEIVHELELAARHAAAAHKRVAPRDNELATALGLSEIGCLVLGVIAADSYAAIRRRNEPRHEVEREVLSITHAEVGAYLLGIWGLPLSIVDAVAYHHAPEGAKIAPRLAAMTHVISHTIAGLELAHDQLERMGLTAEASEWAARAVAEGLQ